MPSHNTLAHLRALLEAENGWALAPADDGSLAFQTAAGTIVTLSPLVPYAASAEPNPPGPLESSAYIGGIRFICDTDVSATAMSVGALSDVLLFNYVLTNTMGGGLSIHPERGTIVLSMALSATAATPATADAAALANSTIATMTALLDVARVADEARETMIRSQMLCAIKPPALAGVPGFASPGAMVNRV